MPISVEVPESVAGVRRRARRRRGRARRRHAGDAAHHHRGARRRDARQPAPRRAGRDRGRGRRRRRSARRRRCARVGADARLAFLRPVIESIASPTIRNLATVGGNLFVEQPYGDLAVALLALDARSTSPARRGDARRRRRAGELRAGDVVTAVRFALPAEARSATRRRCAGGSTRPRSSRSPRSLGRTRRGVALGGAGRKPVRSAGGRGRARRRAARPRARGGRGRAPRSTTPSRSPTPTPAPGTGRASCPSTSAAP